MTFWERVVNGHDSLPVLPETEACTGELVMCAAGIEEAATESISTKSSWLAIEIFSLTVVTSSASGTIVTED